MLYIIGTNRKERRVITATAEEIIKNALEQKKQGIKPHYSWFDYKTREPITPPRLAGVVKY